MTLDDAVRLQEKWKARMDQKICDHRQVISDLVLPDGITTNQKVCMVCGAVHGSPSSITLTT